MAFTKYEKNSKSTCPTISISPSGSIGINTAALEKFFKEAKGVELYFDPEEDRIGIKPHKKASDRLYPLHKRGDTSKSASLSGRGFLKHFGVDIEEMQRFLPAWNKKEELVEIHLDKPMSTENLEKVAAKERKGMSQDGGVEL